jgi:hypothetical protein
MSVKYILSNNGNHCNSGSQKQNRRIGKTLYCFAPLGNDDYALKK